MNERERQVRYVLHHGIAHPMLVVFPRLGAWLHHVTEPCPARDPEPSFADGLHVQRVLDAVERSAAAGSAWTSTDGAAA